MLRPEHSDEVRDFGRLIKQTISEWSDDKAPTYAAALAYYTIFSIAPLLIIAVGVAGFVFGGDAVRGDVHRELEGLIGTSGAKVIEDMMVSAGKPGAGIPATSLGVVVLFFGASGVFAQLQETMNVIWKVKPKPTSGIIDYLRHRFLSFAMVLGIGFLLLVSLVINAAIAAVFSGGGRASSEIPRGRRVPAAGCRPRRLRALPPTTGGPELSASPPTSTPICCTNNPGNRGKMYNR